MVENPVITVIALAAVVGGGGLMWRLMWGLNSRVTALETWRSMQDRDHG